MQDINEKKYLMCRVCGYYWDAKKGIPTCLKGKHDCIPISKELLSLNQILNKFNQSMDNVD